MCFASERFCGAFARHQTAACCHLGQSNSCLVSRASCLVPRVRPSPSTRPSASASKVPEELLKPSYLLLEPVRYTLAEILRLCRRPMVLPGPLVKCMLQDLLGAVTICHDRSIVIKSLDAEKVGRTTIVYTCFVSFRIMYRLRSSFCQAFHPVADRRYASSSGPRTKAQHK